MFSRIGILVGTLGGMLTVAGLCSAVQVDGYAYLVGDTNHANTKVLFEANTPGAVTDSTYTDSSGHYQIDLAAGFYDITYSHEGYWTEELLDQPIFSVMPLPEVNLFIPLSGNLSGVLEPNTYLVVSDISAGNLTVEPGVIFLFNGDYNFTISGSGVHAWGTDEDSIKFLPRESGISWGGIIISNYSSSSLDYCLITASNSHGISIVNYSNPTISNCTIVGNSASNGGGIYLSNSDPIINHCTIISNSATGGGYGGGISMYSSSPTISYCIINGNSATYAGGGIYMNSYSPVINHCTISGNTATYGGGIDINGSNPIITNTIIEGNNEIGIHGTFPNAYVSYNDFYGNNGGPFGGSLPPYLGQIVTVNANGDSCDAFFNIFEYPLFVNPSAGDFHLQAGSPCIDAGDPTSPPDPDSTIADIGAFYYDQSYVPPEPDIEVSTEQLSFGSVIIGNQADLPLTIYNIGDTTLVLYDITTSEPAFTTDWNPADSLIAPGDSLLITAFFAPAEITSYSLILTIDNNDELVEVALRGEGIGPVNVNLTPYNPPIVIPEGGGSFEFNIAARNLTGEPQTFDLWTQIELPGVGSIEVLAVTDITLAGGARIDRDRTQQVPSFAPAGTYTYWSFVGDHPWVIEDYDSFTFVKEGEDQGGFLGTPADWSCSGEPLDLELESKNLPEVYALHAPFPNPFNPTTTIRFDLPEAGWVKLEVFDVAGRIVGAVREPPLHDQWLNAGTHQITFDGSELASGIYFVHLKAGNLSQVRKIVLVE